MARLPHQGRVADEPNNPLPNKIRKNERSKTTLSKYQASFCAEPPKPYNLLPMGQQTAQIYLQSTQSTFGSQAAVHCNLT